MGGSEARLWYSNYGWIHPFVTMSLLCAVAHGRNPLSHVTPLPYLCLCADDAFPTSLVPIICQFQKQQQLPTLTSDRLVARGQSFIYYIQPWLIYSSWVRIASDRDQLGRGSDRVKSISFPSTFLDPTRKAIQQVINQTYTSTSQLTSCHITLSSDPLTSKLVYTSPLVKRKTPHLLEPPHQALAQSTIVSYTTPNQYAIILHQNENEGKRRETVELGIEYRVVISKVRKQIWMLVDLKSFDVLIVLPIYVCWPKASICHLQIGSFL